MSNMQKTFGTEFASSGSFPKDQWRTLVGQHGPPDQEAEAYTPDNVKVIRNVGLQLELAKRDYWQHPYTGGWVDTQGRFSQAYGHFEMLAKMPQANGIWPALAMYGENGQWPPEIDVVEYIYAPKGHRPDKSVPGQASWPETTMHWADASGQHRFMHPELNSDQKRLRVFDWDKTPPPAGMSADYTGYHLYAVDWRPNSLVWLVDNKPVFCMSDDASTGERVPHTPMYMVLSDSVAASTAEKPHWSGFIEPTQTFPLEFDIAYVRVYQYKDLPEEHHLALDITHVTVSDPTPTPGETITVGATLQVGPADLGHGKLAIGVYDFYNPHQYMGINNVKQVTDIQVPELAANKSYHVETTYVVPVDAAPGYYGIDAKANYSSGPGNDNRGPWPNGIRLKQAAIYTVRAR